MRFRARTLAALAAALLLPLSGCGDSTVSVELPPSPTPSAVSTLTVVPAPEGADFGLVGEHYTLSNGPVGATLGECSGDTDILMPAAIRGTYDSIPEYELEFVFDAEMPVTFSAYRYQGGEALPDESIKRTDAEGYVERLGEDGSYKRYSGAGLRTPVPYDPFGELSETGGPEESDVPALSGENTVRVKLPLADPGMYRYTLYFRENIDHTAANCTTGDKLFSITFDVKIPRSDRKFDLLALGGRCSDVEDGGTFCALNTLIRSNSGELLCYNLTKGGTLEMLDGDGWTEIEDSVLTAEGGPAGDTMSGNVIGGLLTSSQGFSAPDPGVEYRFTPVFTDDYKTDYRLPLYLTLME